MLPSKTIIHHNLMNALKNKRDPLKLTSNIFLLTFRKLYKNWHKTIPVTRHNRQPGDEALGLPAQSRFGEGRAVTFYRSATGMQAHEKIALARGPMIPYSTLNDRILKWRCLTTCCVHIDSPARWRHSHVQRGRARLPCTMLGSGPACYRLGWEWKILLEFDPLDN